jgi:hypothetical protein
MTYTAAVMRSFWRRMEEDIFFGISGQLLMALGIIMLKHKQGI